MLQSLFYLGLPRTERSPGFWAVSCTPQTLWIRRRDKAVGSKKPVRRAKGGTGVVSSDSKLETNSWKLSGPRTCLCINLAQVDRLF